MATNNDQVLFAPQTQYGDQIAGTITARYDSSPCHDRGMNMVAYSMDNKSCMTTAEEHTQHLMAGHDVVPRIATGYAVRRLTPTECERLQGFPDDWTKIPYKGKPAEECPDGPRYKALGNSMAVPCMRWIGERIQKIEEDIG